MNFLKNLLRFSRVHTIIGTSLSIVTLWLIALAVNRDGAITDWMWPELIWTLVSCLGANVFIVGLNQLTDIEIDRINKPYLPLASGAWTERTGWIVVTVSVVLSLLIALWQGDYLLYTVLLSLLLGTLYSLPPIRLKRFPFWAAFCILAVRGLIINLLLYLHFHYLLSANSVVPTIVWVLTAAMFGYSIIIAFFKDMPDLEGDRRYGIQTFSLRLGLDRIHQIGSLLIAGIYLVLIILPFFLEMEGNALVFSGAHIVLLGLLFWGNRRLDLSDQNSIRFYYQFIWGLFFLEYISVAVAVWS